MPEVPLAAMHEVIARMLRKGSEAECWEGLDDLLCNEPWTDELEIPQHIAAEQLPEHVMTQLVDEWERRTIESQFPAAECRIASEVAAPEPPRQAPQCAAVVTIHGSCQVYAAEII